MDVQENHKPRTMGPGQSQPSLSLHENHCWSFRNLLFSFVVCRATPFYSQCHGTVVYVFATAKVPDFHIRPPHWYSEVPWGTGNLSASHCWCRGSATMGMFSRWNHNSLSLKASWVDLLSRMTIVRIIGPFGFESSTGKSCLWLRVTLPPSPWNDDLSNAQLMVKLVSSAQPLNLLMVNSERSTHHAGYQMLNLSI